MRKRFSRLPANETNIENRAFFKIHYTVWQENRFGVENINMTMISVKITTQRFIK